MSEAERNRLAETRRLIFTNLANGVPINHVMHANRMSEKEVKGHFEFVRKKIVEYRFQRALQYLPCTDEAGVRANRIGLLQTLAKLGPSYLTSDFHTGPITAIPLHDKVVDEKLEQIEAYQSEGRY